MKRPLSCSLLAGLLGLAGMSNGCVLATDLINPALLTGLGLDIGTLRPDPGTIILVFVNATGFPVEFHTVVSTDQVDLSKNSKNVTVLVLPDEQNQNEVLDCPVGLVRPGEVTDEFDVETRGAIVYDGEGNEGTDVAYEFASLLAQRDYSCGDVIQITLLPVGGGDNAEYGFQVQVLPGR